jgi:hypothetical protein
MCRGFEARLHKDGRLRETGRASSATGYLLREEMVGFVFVWGLREMGVPTKEGWSAHKDSEGAHSVGGCAGGARRLWRGIRS